MTAADAHRPTSDAGRDHPLDAPTRESIAVHLRERIYVTFASLAVVLTLGVHAEDLGAGAAALSLAVSAAGTVVAAYAADLISHVVVHGAFPDRSEGRSMRSASLGAFTVIALPLLAVGLAALGVWSVQTALAIGAALLVATLCLVTWLGVRRAERLSTAQKVAALVGLTLLGLIVVGLKLLAGH